MANGNILVSAPEALGYTFDTFSLSLEVQTFKKTTEMLLKKYLFLIND
jgi:hypothetical protein